MEDIYRIVDELVVLVWDLFVDGLLGAPGRNPYPALAGEFGWEPFEVEELFEEIGVQPWEIIEELCDGDPLDFFRGVDTERTESSRGGRQ
jgi:hypothetical protein